MDIYLARRQKIVEKYIVTRTIMYLCLAAERRPGTRLLKFLWDRSALTCSGCGRRIRRSNWKIGRKRSLGRRKRTSWGDTIAFLIPYVIILVLPYTMLRVWNTPT